MILLSDLDTSKNPWEICKACHWEETQRQTKKKLEALCILPGKEYLAIFLSELERAAGKTVVWKGLRYWQEKETKSCK